MMLAVAMVMPLPRDMTTQWEIKSCSGCLEKARKRQPRAQMSPPITPYRRGLLRRQMIVTKGAMNSEMPMPRLPSQAVLGHKEEVISKTHNNGCSAKVRTDFKNTLRLQCKGKNRFQKYTMVAVQR